MAECRGDVTVEEVLAQSETHGKIEDDLEAFGRDELPPYGPGSHGPPHEPADRLLQWR